MSDAIVRGMPRVPPPPPKALPQSFASAEPAFRLPSLWKLAALAMCAWMAYSLLSCAWYVFGPYGAVYLACAMGVALSVIVSIFRP